MKAKGSAIARSALVSTLVSHAPMPPSQCVTSPTQAAPSPSQLEVVEPGPGEEAETAREAAATAAAVVVVEYVQVYVAAAVVAARARPAALDDVGVVVVVKN
jgi:hypothetical protein